MTRTITILFIVALSVFLPAGLRSADVTVDERMEQIGSAVRLRLKPWFARQRIDYPPKRVTLLAVKDTRRLKIFVPDTSGSLRFVMQYQIAKLSGKPGPKLRSGDKQVPEGVYSITHLNPTSKFWLSLALNYPNKFDRRQAEKDDRSNLGRDIMLHGYWFSTGCIALGNTAAEDMFVLANDVGIDNVKVVIVPTDFRTNDLDAFEAPSKPEWIDELYENLSDELNTLGTDGMTTDTRLIAYYDLAPPPPPEPDSLFGKILKALAEAAETTATSKTHGP